MLETPVIVSQLSLADDLLREHLTNQISVPPLSKGGYCFPTLLTRSHPPARALLTARSADNLACSSSSGEKRSGMMVYPSSSY